jgi:hypothetical protein
MIAIMNDSNR